MIASTKKRLKPQANLSWGDVLDELKNKESINSDAELARSLGISRGFISLIRMHKKRLSPRLAEDVYRRLGKENQSYLIDAPMFAEKIQVRSASLMQLRVLVIDRAGGICQLCDKSAPFLDLKGRPYLEIHHVKPMKRGGEHNLSNLVALCPNCNQKMRINPSEADQYKLKTVITGFR